MGQWVVQSLILEAKGWIVTDQPNITKPDLGKWKKVVFTIQDPQLAHKFRDPHPLVAIWTELPAQKQAHTNWARTNLGSKPKKNWHDYDHCGVLERRPTKQNKVLEPLQQHVVKCPGTVCLLEGPDTDFRGGNTKGRWSRRGSKAVEKFFCVKASVCKGVCVKTVVHKDFCA